MKVLQVLYSGLGGHGSVVTSLINADREKKWQHSLLFYGIEDLLPAYKEFCEVRDISYSVVKKKRGKINTGFFSLRRNLLNVDPDVIILHNPNLVFSAVLYGLFRKKKIIVVEHTSNSLKSFFNWGISLFSLILSDRVVYLSKRFQLQVKEKLRLFPVSKKSVVIENGIDLDRFKPIHKLPNNELKAGMIGRFTPPKNQAMIIDIITKALAEKKISQVQVLFAGGGEMEAKLKEAVKQKELDSIFHFAGLLKENEIVEFLQSLDFYVHASYAEAMCTSVQQALACGLPVLASDIPGINDIVSKGENAFLFENGDENTFVEYLSKLSDPVLRKEMGQNARQYAEEHFSSKLMFVKYDSLITGK